MSTYPVVYQQTPAVKRSRLTIFFRGIMSIPLEIWSLFYVLAAGVVVFLAWFAILFTGRYPAGMYGFVAGYTRFATRLAAYAYLVTDAYPPFDGGEHPAYPVTVAIAPPPLRLSRVTTFFRYPLLIPVAVIQFAFVIWLYLLAIALWFVGVITGKTSPGLTGAALFPLAYLTRALAYSNLLTDRWPPLDDR
ncbi:MAG TPA: DUF4389 domain-containing protein [Solirubrobacteraceae bacterium]